jgi:hypothetical protein
MEWRMTLEQADRSEVLHGATWGLPVLHVHRGLGQVCHLPRLAAAAVPVDVRVAESHQPQGEVAALVALRVEAHGYDRYSSVAVGQLLHLPSKSVLKLVRQAAADAGAPQPDGRCGRMSAIPTSAAASHLTSKAALIRARPLCSLATARRCGSRGSSRPLPDRT